MSTLMRVLVPFHQTKHKTGLQQMHLTLFKTASTIAVLKHRACIYRRRNRPESLVPIIIALTGGLLSAGCY